MLESSAYDPGVHEELPFAVRHVLEHWNLACFGLTDASSGGLNINVMDQSSHETLVPARQIVDVIAALEELVNDHPLACLPSLKDRDSWSQLLAPFFPRKTPAVVETVVSAVTGGHRRHLWRKTVHPHLDKLFSLPPVSYSRFLPTHSERWHKNRPYISVPVTREPHLTPAGILSSMREDMEQAAVKAGYPPIQRPTVVPPPDTPPTQGSPTQAPPTIAPSTMTA